MTFPLIGIPGLPGRLAAKGANQYRAFSLIGLLLGIQLLFGLLFGGGVLALLTLTGPVPRWATTASAGTSG